MIKLQQILIINNFCIPSAITFEIEGRGLMNFMISSSSLSDVAKDIESAETTTIILYKNQSNELCNL